MTKLILFLVRAYRTGVSAVFPPTCRHYPSCSAYVEDALRRHGWRRGGLLAARRLLRCGPWGTRGYDPVP